MKKSFLRIVFFFICVSLFFFCGATWAITTEGRSVGAHKSEKRENFFLSWDNTYLRTTQGTVYVKGLDINNYTKLNKDELNNTTHPPNVVFTVKGNRVVQVDIYPLEAK